MTSHYQRGREAEWRARDELAAGGNHVVRASSSKGTWDIVAVDPYGVLLISLKSTSKEEYARKTLRAELKRLAAIPVPDNCTQEVWVWLKGRGWIYKEVVQQCSDSRPTGSDGSTLPPGSKPKEQSECSRSSKAQPRDAPVVAPPTVFAATSPTQTPKSCSSSRKRSGSAASR